MASHTAMLLDPRAYRKQLQTPPTATATAATANGNGDPGPLPSTSPGHFNSYAGFTKGSHPPDAPTSFFPSLIRCPSPPDDPVDPVFYSSPDSALSPSGSRKAFGLLVLETTGQQNPNLPSRNYAPPSIAPPGTVSAAQHLLHPQRRPSSRTGLKSSRSPQRVPSRSNSNTRGVVPRSPQPAPKAESTVDVEFATPVQDASDLGDGHNGVPESLHGRLLEDIYGVERRESQPRKRIKTVDPSAEELQQQQQQAKRRHFSMAGNNGFGEWMKEDQGESKPRTSATTNIVDLTLGKDMDNMCQFKFFTTNTSLYGSLQMLLVAMAMAMTMTMTCKLPDPTI